MKRLKIIEGKNEQQLEAIKDRGEKQLQISTKKTDNVDSFENTSFKNKLKPEGRIAYRGILKEDEKLKNLPALAQVRIDIILSSF